MCIQWWCPRHIVPLLLLLLLSTGMNSSTNQFNRCVAHTAALDKPSCRHFNHDSQVLSRRVAFGYFVSLVCQHCNAAGNYTRASLSRTWAQAVAIVLLTYSRSTWLDCGYISRRAEDPALSGALFGEHMSLCSNDLCSFIIYVCRWSRIGHYYLNNSNVARTVELLSCI